MLQDIRQNVKGTAAKIVVGLIVISFSFFGIQSILVGGGSNEIAQVNGEDIYPGELQQAVYTQKRRLISMMGENFDPALVDDDRLKPQALESLIRRKLLMQSAQGMKLTISEEAIGSLVSGMEDFQVDGKFSPAVYKSVLSNAGYTPAFFKQSLQDDMLLSQLRSGLAGSEFATPTELGLGARIVGEQRDIRYFTIPQENYASESAVSDVQVETYYSENESAFLTPESVDLDYIELDIDGFKQPVPESAIVEAFEQAQEALVYQTQNRISHILFEDNGEGDVDERVALALEKLAAGSEFTEVAKELSDDAGSANQGGDLGFSSGDAFPAEMENAVAQLEVGVVSSPVKTDAGTHLILVTERNEAQQPDLEEMRAELQERLQLDEARVALLRAVESLKDLTFNADDLDSPAAELELVVAQAEDVTRFETEGPFANAAIIEAAFSEDVLQAGHNSEVIEIADDRFVVLRVRRHNTPQVKPLETVRAGIVAAINKENAAAALALEADRVLAELRAGTALDQLTSNDGYQWQVELGVDRRNATVPTEILRHVFTLPVPDDASGVVLDTLTTPAGDVAVIELSQVTEGSYDAFEVAQRNQLQQQVNAEFGSLVDNEYQRNLRQGAEIVVR